MSGSAAPRHISVFRVLLVALSIVTVALGLWRWGQHRSMIAQESKSSMSSENLTVAPDFTLQNLQGETVRLSDLRGQVVLLNFWATWCLPCIAEMPDLNALHTRYGQPYGFTVLAVNQKEVAQTVQAFVDAHGLIFPVVLDSDGVALKRFNVRAMPMSLIIDRDGNIRDAWQGQIAREAMLIRLKRVW